MKSLSLEHPENQVIEDWNQRSMESFREDSWLGRPESSLELHLLSGTKPLDAASFGRLEPFLDNLRVLGCFKDISIEDMFELQHDEDYSHRLVEIDRAYAEEGNWEMSSYLESIYDAVPDRDVSLEFFSEEADIDNLSYNSAIVEEIEDSMREDKDFSITGIELNAYNEGSDAENVYNGLENSLFFDIYFLYGGDQTLVREYNQVTDDWGDTNQYSGVPGVIHVGGERPVAYFSESEQLSLDAARVDAWLYDTLDSNVGSRSKVRKKNLE